MPTVPSNMRRFYEPRWVNGWFIARCEGAQSHGGTPKSPLDHFSIETDSFGDTFQ